MRDEPPMLFTRSLGSLRPVNIQAQHAVQALEPGEQAVERGTLGDPHQHGQHGLDTRASKSSGTVDPCALSAQQRTGLLLGVKGWRGQKRSSSSCLFIYQCPNGLFWDALR